MTIKAERRSSKSGNPANADQKSRENFVRKSNPRLHFPSLFLICAVLFGSSISIFAQQEDTQNPTQQEDTQISAPPPMKAISKDEKNQLSAVTDVKKHTILALELIESRLASAENFNNQKQFQQMFNQLGEFHALVDDTLDYLTKHDTDSNKVLNNFKRLELGLRKFTPRLELIRRDLPNRFEPYVRHLIIYLREARTKAVEPMFSNSVVSGSDIKKHNEN